MKRWIKKCKNCNIYTLKELCPKCSLKTYEVNPINIGLEDPYQIYRIKEKIKKLNINCQTEK